MIRGKPGHDHWCHNDCKPRSYARCADRRADCNWIGPAGDMAADDCIHPDRLAKIQGWFGPADRISLHGPYHCGDGHPVCPYRIQGIHGRDWGQLIARFRNSDRCSCRSAAPTLRSSGARSGRSAMISRRSIGLIFDQRVISSMERRQPVHSRASGMDDAYLDAGAFDLVHASRVSSLVAAPSLRDHPQAGPARLEGYTLLRRDQ